MECVRNDFRADGPIARRSIESPEEERLEDSSLITSSRSHATGVAVGEKTEISVEPTFRFEKGKEDQARDVKKRQLMPLGAIYPLVDRRGQLGYRFLECPKESTRDGFAAEDVEPARVGDQIRVADRVESAQSVSASLSNSRSRLHTRETTRGLDCLADQHTIATSRVVAWVETTSQRSCGAFFARAVATAVRHSLRSVRPSRSSARARSAPSPSDILAERMVSGRASAFLARMSSGSIGSLNPSVAKDLRGSVGRSGAPQQRRRALESLHPSSVAATNAGANIV